ncbi:MAG TPA: 50S ribosomal protein L29 [Polyangiaceae bacterium]|jgi:large subunit ribosomal protein L29|nr:50S ribosomal protein L29 [Polyangiaceae bacterium]
MKSKDLRERSSEDLAELKANLTKDLFSHKMKNFTGQLDDTSMIGKTRRDIARIELLLSERAAKGAKS